MSIKKTKNEADKFKWKVTANRFVGIIDIMGFKDLVARNSHETIYELMKRVSKAIIETQSIFSIDLESDNFDENVMMMTYSDSIMIYSRDNSNSCLENFITIVSAFSEELFKAGIPHKGAVAFGKMTLDFESSIFFGQPLIDAYLLQEEFQLYGIAVHSTAEFENNFCQDESVLEYNCPFKSGFAKHYTIIPKLFFSDPFEDEEYETLIEAVNGLKINTSGALRKYIDNTISYLDYSKEVYLRKVLKFKKEQNSNKTCDKLPF